MKKFLTWVALILVGLWAYRNPSGMASFMHHIMDALNTLATSL